MNNVWQPILHHIIESSIIFCRLYCTYVRRRKFPSKNQGCPCNELATLGGYIQSNGFRKSLTLTCNDIRPLSVYLSGLPPISLLRIQGELPGACSSARLSSRLSRWLCSYFCVLVRPLNSTGNPGLITHISSARPIQNHLVGS